MNENLFKLMKESIGAQHGGALIAFELVLHRALERELAKQVQDPSSINVFRMVIRELGDLRGASDHD